MDRKSTSHDQKPQHTCNFCVGHCWPYWLSPEVHFPVASQRCSSVGHHAWLGWVGAKPRSAGLGTCRERQMARCDALVIVHDHVMGVRWAVLILLRIRSGSSTVSRSWTLRKRVERRPISMYRYKRCRERVGASWPSRETYLSLWRAIRKQRPNPYSYLVHFTSSHH